MISIDKSNKPGEPPRRYVRFTWVEPTHEVVSVLEAAGITDVFHSVGAQYVLDQTLVDGLRPEAVDVFMEENVKGMLAELGPAILAQQKPMESPVKRVEVTA